MGYCQHSHVTSPNQLRMKPSESFLSQNALAADAAAVRELEHFAAELSLAIDAPCRVAQLDVGEHPFVCDWRYVICPSKHIKLAEAFRRGWGAHRTRPGDSR